MLIPSAYYDFRHIVTSETHAFPDALYSQFRATQPEKQHMKSIALLTQLAYPWGVRACSERAFKGECAPLYG